MVQKHFLTSTSWWSIQNINCYTVRRDTCIISFGQGAHASYMFVMIHILQKPSTLALSRGRHTVSSSVGIDWWMDGWMIDWSIDWLIDWFIVDCFTSSCKIFHSYRGTSPWPLKVCTARSEAFWAGGIFIVPRMLWHGTSVFAVWPEGPPYLVTCCTTSNGHWPPVLTRRPYGFVGLWPPPPNFAIFYYKIFGKYNHSLDIFDYCDLTCGLPHQDTCFIIQRTIVLWTWDSCEYLALNSIVSDLIVHRNRSNRMKTTRLIYFRSYRFDS